MTTYSDWVQGGDVTSSVDGFSNADLRQTITSNYGYTQYSSGGDQASVISTAATSERDRCDPVEFYTPGGLQGTPFSATTTAILGPTQDPPYSFIGHGKRDDAGLTVNASAAILQWQANYANTIPLPAGATGVQLESSTFVPVAASVAVPMDDRVQNNESDGATATTPLVVDFYLRPADQSGSMGGTAEGRRVLRHTTSSTESPVTYTLQFDAMESDLAPGNGGLILWPLANYTLSPDWSVTAAPVPRYADWLVGRQLAIQSGATVTTTWTLRPPRHRFVYDAAPYVPPLRQYPTRGDGLGADSHRTLYPPPQTLQGGQGGIRGGFL